MAQRPGLRPWPPAECRFTGGPAELTRAQRDRLARHQIELVEEAGVRLEGEGKAVRRLILASGRQLPCRALFFAAAQEQACSLPEQLGCRLSPRLNEVVTTESAAARSTRDLYVVGNASEGPQLAIVAAAEGAIAARDIQGSLIDEDYP